MKMYLKKSSFCVLSLLLSASAAWGQEKNMADREAVLLDRITVTGGEEGVDDIPGSAQFITDIELDKHEYNDIHRVLNSVPGLNIQEEEGYGNRPNIGIRGSRNERSASITLMEDGVLIAPAPYASPSAYYFPRVDRMESVEVRKGSSSIKYGPRTTTGAVNLLSSSIPTETKIEGMVAGGNYDTQRINSSVGTSKKHYGFVIDLGHEQTDGFKEIDIVGGSTGFSIQDAMAKFRINSDPTADIYNSLEFKIGGTKEDSEETYLGLSSADFSADPYRRYAASQEDNMTSNHQQYQLRHFFENDNFDVTTTLYQNDFKRNWYKIQSVEIGGVTKNIGTALNDASYLAALKGESDLAGSATDNITLRANNREYTSKGIQTQFVTDVKLAGVNNNIEIGARLHTDEEDRKQHEDQFSITNGVMSKTIAGAESSQTNRVTTADAWSLYIEDEIELGKLTLTPGVRYESVELKRENYSTSDPNREQGPTSTFKHEVDDIIPGIGSSYAVNDNLTLLAGIHKGFAPPAAPVSATDSPDPEESVNYEAGARANIYGVKTEFIGYFNDYSNLLAECTLSSGCTLDDDGNTINGGEVDVYGIEFGAEYDLAKQIKTEYRLPIRFNYTYTKAEFQTDFAAAGFDEWGTVAKGDEVPYVPRHQYFISSGIENDVWSLNLAGKFVDEMRTVAGSGPLLEDNKTDSRFILDVAGEYNLNKNAAAFLTVDNIFDEKYVAARRPAGARPGRPLTFLTGVKITF